MRNRRSPGFEVNDLAYLDRADYKWFNANISRVWTVPTSWYRNISTIVGEQRQYTYDGLETDEEPHAFYAMEFPNYWNLRTFWIYKPTLDDDRLTRGGPVVKHTGYNFGHFQVSTDARKRAVLDMSVEVAHGGTHPRARSRCHQVSRSSQWRACSCSFRRRSGGMRTRRST
jgi:hypothetical protein